MNDDQLRNRITAIDPVPPGAATDPADSPSARTLLEAVMTHDDTTDAAATVTEITTKRRRPVLAICAAAVAVLAGATVAGVFGGDDEREDLATVATTVSAVDETLRIDTPASDDEATADESGESAGAASVLELSAGTTDPMMMSCIRPDASVVAQSPTAFRGIVESIGGDDQTAQVTLAVDRWYVGGDADVVTIAAPLGLEALIGSIDFVEGEPYLISAFQGTISYCGLSGAATPELQAMYDEAFPD